MGIFFSECRAHAGSVLAEPRGLSAWSVNAAMMKTRSPKKSAESKACVPIGAQCA